MKRNEEKPATGNANTSQEEKVEITSNSIENAHATGDGAVQKIDEWLPAEDEKQTTTDTNPY